MSFNPLAQSGFTGSFSKAGLRIGGTKSGVGLAAPNGAGTDFAINGVAYYKADAATAAITAAVAQAAGTTCVYLIQLSSAGVVSSVKGVEVPNADMGVNDAAQVPGPAVDYCPIGAIVVTTVAVTFTAGTTLLDATGVETDYIDFMGGIQNFPEIAKSVA